jgi:hypothetical protein
MAYEAMFATGGEPSSQGHLAQTAVSSTRSHGSRTQTKWPKEKLAATRLDVNFQPTPEATMDKFVLVCGLIARKRVLINKAVDDLSPIEKEHLFTVLDEKLDYPANLEEFVCKKAVKATVSEIGTLQWWFKAHLRKKYVSEKETPFVKHAFLHQQDWDIFVRETNSPSFQQLSQEMKQKRALHNKPHKMGKRGEGCKARCRRKTKPLGPISWTFETFSAGKGREEEKRVLVKEAGA